MQKCRLHALFLSLSLSFLCPLSTKQARVIRDEQLGGRWTNENRPSANDDFRDRPKANQTTIREKQIWHRSKHCRS
ncbi:hypothetical protein ASPBRDRAFT_41373 [Aspergillus brasiliensis CBS 101740]|uniref:Secreted protein n=1 Tax=Aspergillus brasiliensis (strain CBS 101740 / IMI 381727 / IBT 21946) TaxID=767769 RepID=A0A1L9UQ51_ASPBC|nr:hypothetical protein ASPBRDRAFT_41373 [Aspergillus brasiliensis CBS 101740]